MTKWRYLVSFISPVCSCPFHLEIVTVGKICLPTCIKAFFSQKKLTKLFSPIIEIVKGALFSRICCRIFLFSSPKKERVPKCCPLRKTSRMFVCSPRSPRKVSQVLNSFLISCQLFLSICCAYNNTQGYFSLFLFPFWIVSFHMAIMLKPIKESNIVQD